MAVKRLSDVSVGSRISLGGVVYKVATNNVHGVFVQREARPGFYHENKVNVADLISNYGGRSNQLVTVVEEQSSTQTSTLTSELQAQVRQNSLTDSLRSQVDEDAEDEYEEYGDLEYDWDDEEEEEEEVQPSPIWHSPNHFVSTQPAIFHNPGFEEAKKASLSASLRSQQAQKAANEAKFQASTVAKKAEATALEVGDLSATLSAVDEDVYGLTLRSNEQDRAIGAVQDYAYSVSDVAHNALRTAQRVEQKQTQEEQKMSLQNELNQKLAMQKKFNESVSKNKTTGGNGTMKNVLGAIKNQFGKVEGKFAFSPVTGGLALRKGISQEFVAYNKEAKELTDVSGLTLKFDVPAFKLPVAANQVAVGDLVIHNNEYVYVTKKADGYLETLNPEKAVNGSVVPTKNALLGAAFYTVVKTLDAAGQGGFNPMMLMAMGDGNKDELVKIMALTGGLGGTQGEAGQIDPMMFALLGDNMDDLLPLMLMQQGGAVGGQGIQSMLPFLLMGDKGGKSKDLLPLLMMSGGLGGAQGQAGQMNPMMMMALAGDGEMDMTTLALMGGFGGQGGLFGGQAPTQTPASNTDAE